MTIYCNIMLYLVVPGGPGILIDPGDRFPHYGSSDSVPNDALQIRVGIVRAIRMMVMSVQALVTMEMAGMICQVSLPKGRTRNVHS